ncbi:hypothetical protein L210DRAFT_2052702 [Boletus edulis BED1]|uniref:Uncharacterized protein n=1 Tax=Boletus edulis BED1 TaxID=1328754 RepID=A0AAD4CAL3_BOLED|nr:hypothetical protein L210DRAFT_2052702 [Boletus edulis BED1]
MSFKRNPPTDAPPAYRYVSRVYGRNLRPVVVAISVITALWALAWTVSSFKSLKLADNDDLPKLAPLAIAQGVMYAVACAFQTFGIVAAVLQRFTLVKTYAFLCAMSTLLVAGVGLMRVVTHFVYKSDWLTECTILAQTGSINSVFGIWGSNPPTSLNAAEAAQFCKDEWNHDSGVEIVAVIFGILFGLAFTAIAFAYYRQVLDPTSPANASRLPSDSARQDGYPTHYNPPYDGSSYTPVYSPPPGPPPTDNKPPEYKRGSYLSTGMDKDAKASDPFSDYDGPSIPMPTHWVEDRDASRV